MRRVDHKISQHLLLSGRIQTMEIIITLQSITITMKIPISLTREARISIYLV
jgi:hypothetical protein